MRPLAVANLLTATAEDYRMYHRASLIYVKFMTTVRNLKVNPDPDSSFENIRIFGDSINANQFLSGYGWHHVNGEVRFKRLNA